MRVVRRGQIGRAHCVRDTLAHDNVHRIRSLRSPPEPGDGTEFDDRLRGAQNVLPAARDDGVSHLLHPVDTVRGVEDDEKRSAAVRLGGSSQTVDRVYQLALHN